MVGLAGLRPVPREQGSVRGQVLGNDREIIEKIIEKAPCLKDRGYEEWGIGFEQFWLSREYSYPSVLFLPPVGTFSIG